MSALDYASASFVGFVLLAWLAFRVAPARLRRSVVLAASLFLLANLLSWQALCLYALLSLSTWLAGVAISRGARHRALLFYGALALLIGVFLTLRAPLLRDAIEASSGGALLAHGLGVVIGYSYFLFKSINFLVSVYVGSTQRFDLVDFLDFLFFFPSFTAGPIARYADRSEREFSARAPARQVVEGLHRILNGMIKKYVIVDVVAQFSLAAFESPEQIRSVPAGWAATWGYLLYIYVDFSAYSDIAIGIGLLFGYRLPENFDYPLLKRNLVLFWESWHMSLTSWIRDHVFTPLNWRFLQLRGFRRSEGLSLVSYLATMSVFGLWHSLTPPFLLFGALHGSALWVNQRAIALRRKHLSETANRFLETHPVPRILGALGVNAFVALSLVLFRYDLSESFALVRFLFTGSRA